MSKAVNANNILKRAVSSKWGWDEDNFPGSNARKEWWYQKLAEARRRKLLRCSEQQNHRCCYCSRKTWHPSYGETGPKRLMATLEHVVTRREGGTDSMNNLTMACYRCNNERSDHFTAEEFYEMVVGLRPRRSASTKVVSLEDLAKKQANSEQRKNVLIMNMAVLFHQLDLWNWLDSWVTYSVPMLKQE
jgi:5-methylcytosine-specific restriction endonuclease McrA